MDRNFAIVAIVQFGLLATEVCKNDRCAFSVIFCMNAVGNFVKIDRDVEKFFVKILEKVFLTRVKLGLSASL